MDIVLLDGSGSLSVRDDVFGCPFNEPLVHQMVVAYQANARFATRAQKNRATVKHTTHKPYRQKGTGNARAGMSSSPIWRGGGRAFPNLPYENFSHKINKKMYRTGLKSVLSELLRAGRLGIVETFNLDEISTKSFLRKINEFGLTVESGLLLIVPTVSENLYLSARNIPNVEILETHQIDPVSLIRYSRTLMTTDVIKNLEGALSS